MTVEQEEEIYPKPQFRPIINATWAAVEKKSGHGLYCESCQMFMRLYPISKDLDPTHWQCRCRGIALIQRDAVFEKNRQIVQDMFELNKFSYDVENRAWNIQSGEWIGDNRITATRKKISMDDRQNIICELIERISDDLGIGFDNFTEYFIEG